MAELQVLKGLTSQRTFPITQDRMRLGRDPACEIHLEPNCVSRCHAELTRTNKGHRCGRLSEPSWHVSECPANDAPRAVSVAGPGSDPHL